MTSSTEDTSPRCRPRIDHAGLPHRTDALLERERRLYPSLVMALLGDAKGDPDGAEELLTVGLIDEGFGSGDIVGMAASAFLAGRCEPVGDDAAGAHLTEQCRALIEAADAGDGFGPSAWGYAEAGMSLVLRGERDTGSAALQRLAHAVPARTGDEPLAAFYLAQLGDPSGWPAVEAALADAADPVLRIRAARLVLAFATHDGIDARAALERLAKDPEEHVANEIPGLLEELDAALAKGPTPA